MTRRERLLENYEDALFSLLMDEVATSEGKKAIELNERLKNDPSAKVPEDVDRRCLQTIRRAFAVRRAREVGHFTVKALGKVAMAAGIAAMLFVGAFAASETLRVNTINYLIETFDDSVDFHFERNEADANASLPNIEVGWLPDGYVLQEQESGNDELGIWYTYRSSSNGLIMINFYVGDGTILSVDNDDAEISDIEINGIKATLVLDNNQCQIIWSTSNDDKLLSIVGRNITTEDMIHVAENIQY